MNNIIFYEAKEYERRFFERELTDKYNLKFKIMILKIKNFILLQTLNLKSNICCNKKFLQI